MAAVLGCGLQRAAVRLGRVLLYDADAAASTREQIVEETVTEVPAHMRQLEIRKLSCRSAIQTVGGARAPVLHAPHAGRRGVLTELLDGYAALKHQASGEAGALALTREPARTDTLCSASKLPRGSETHKSALSRLRPASLQSVARLRK